MPGRQVTVEKMAAGGDGLGRLPDGRVVFVRGAIAGETATVDVVVEHRDFAEATVTEIVESSPLRIAPPCPAVARGCGGCAWQHIAPAHQLALKVDIVRDALRRTAALPAAAVVAGAAVLPFAYRTTVRLAFSADGRPGMRAVHERRVVVLDDCLISHPALSELFAALRADGPGEVSLRVGVASGERTAMAHPCAVRRGGPVGRPRAPRLHGLPSSVDTGPDAFVHETVAGTMLRVSAGSFFQSGPQAAELLVAAVADACGELPDDAPLLDAYGGVGMFAAALGASRSIVVEAGERACADARHNLRGRHAIICNTPMEKWAPIPVGVAIADPARAGLGAGGAARLAATQASSIVLVSCDPAALARDVRLLGGHGYRHDQSVVLDLFPNTPHVESVTRLRRADAAAVAYGHPDG